MNCKVYKFFFLGLLILLSSCATLNHGNKEVRTMYLVKYENGFRIYNDIKQKKFKDAHWSESRLYFAKNNLVYAGKAKFYPDVYFVGKATIINNKDIVFDFVNKDYQSQMETLFNEMKKTGFKYTIYYREKPETYPKQGKLEAHYIFWRWHGTITYKDKEFIDAFIDTYLYNEGYAQVEMSVGEKYYQVRQIIELEKGELLNATILQKGEVIYKRPDNYDEPIQTIKENPFDHKKDAFPIYM